MKIIIILASIILVSNLAFAQNKIFSFNDLVLFSKSKYGFVQKTGKINEYYGDIECKSAEKKIFDFNVGCGRGGDNISLLVKPNAQKSNHFDLYIQKGDIYFGKSITTDKKVGELFIISENQINGNIKLCLEKDAACCGEEGETFVLKKIK